MSLSISISKGNTKLKNISSFSLPPVKSCLNHKHCAAKCYARKAYQAYPNTTKAYDRNFEIAKDLNILKTQLRNYLDGYKRPYFRIHVSGDFFSQEYLNMWLNIVSEYPNIRFLAFTKVYWFDYSKKPGNLEIVLSTFDSMPDSTDSKLRKKYKLPIALAGQENPNRKKYIACTGDCSVCKSCWHLSEKRKDVFFKYH